MSDSDHDAERPPRAPAPSGGTLDLSQLDFKGPDNAPWLRSQPDWLRSTPPQTSSEHDGATAPDVPIHDAPWSDEAGPRIAKPSPASPQTLEFDTNFLSAGVPTRQSGAVPIVTQAPCSAIAFPWRFVHSAASLVLVLKGQLPLGDLNPTWVDDVDPPSGDDLAPFKPQVDLLLRGGAVSEEAVRLGDAFVYLRPRKGAVAEPAAVVDEGYDAAWLRDAWPHPSTEHDYGRYQLAPEAQRLDALEGNEAFELSITGVAARLVGRPACCFIQRTAAAGGAFEALPLVIDTLRFDLDAGMLEVVCRGRVDCIDDDASDIAAIYLEGEQAGADHPRQVQAAQSRFLQACAAETPAATAPAVPPRPSAVPLNPTARFALLECLERGQPLAAVDLEGADLSGLDLSHCRLAGAFMAGAVLTGCILRSVDLREAQMAGVDLSQAKLDDAKLDGADLYGARLPGASLRGASLERVNLAGATLRDADFGESHGAFVQVTNADATGASFAGCNLPSIDFSHTNLTDACFDNASVEQIRLYAAHGARTSFRGAKLGAARADDMQLVAADLRDVSAPRSTWCRASLCAARFERASLASALFDGSTLSQARFDEADMPAVDFSRANLGKASFSCANLPEASFEFADLREAEFNDANLYRAESRGADLRGAVLEGAHLTDSDILRTLAAAGAA